jgi:hypothetical protein
MTLRVDWKCETLKGRGIALRLVVPSGDVGTCDHPHDNNLIGPRVVVHCVSVWFEYSAFYCFCKHARVAISPFIWLVLPCATNDGNTFI